MLEKLPAGELMSSVYDQAKATGLFDQSVMKVRVLPFSHYIVDGVKQDFVHIYVHIMQGRSEYQKKTLPTELSER